VRRRLTQQRRRLALRLLPVQVRTVDHVQLAHVVASELEPALHLEAVPTCAPGELMECRLASRFKVFPPDLLHLIKLRNKLPLRQHRAGGSGGWAFGCAGHCRRICLELAKDVFEAPQVLIGDGQLLSETDIEVVSGSGIRAVSGILASRLPIENPFGLCLQVLPLLEVLSCLLLIRLLFGRKNLLRPWRVLLNHALLTEEGQRKDKTAAQNCRQETSASHFHAILPYKAPVQ